MRAGRLAGLLVFWTGLIFVTAVGFVSVIPRVFFPTASAWAHEAVRGPCDEEVEKLHSELLGRAGAHVAAGGVAGGDLREFFANWDERYTVLGDRCEGPVADAYHALGKLRHRTETALRRFDRESAPLTRTIARARSYRGAPPRKQSSQ